MEPPWYRAANWARKVHRTNAVQVSHAASVIGLPDMVGSGKATHCPSDSTQARSCTLQYGKLKVVETSKVDNIHELLRVLTAPCAEIADALAMLLLALWVWTGVGPEGDVTPLATLQGTFQSFWPSMAVHGSWSQDQVVPCPGHCGCLLHGSPPLLRAVALLPADPLDLNVPLGRGAQYAVCLRGCGTPHGHTKHTRRGYGLPDMYLQRRCEIPAQGWGCGAEAGSSTPRLGTSGARLTCTARSDTSYVAVRSSG